MPLVRALSREAEASGRLAIGGQAHEISNRCPGAVILPYDAPAYRQRA